MHALGMQCILGQITGTAKAYFEELRSFAASLVEAVVPVGSVLVRILVEESQPDIAMSIRSGVRYLRSMPESRQAQTNPRIAMKWNRFKGVL